MTLGDHIVTVTPAAGGAPVDLSCWVDQVAIRHGRDDPGAQPEASSATLDLATQIGPWPAAVDIGAQVRVTTEVMALEPGTPALVATNLLPNPSFETGTTGWAALRGTISSVPGGVRGANRLRYTADGTAGSQYVTSATAAGSRYPVMGGQPFAASINLTAADVARTWRLNVFWYDAAGVNFASLPGPDVAVPAGAAVTRLTHIVAAAPAAAASGLIRVLCQGTMGAGETIGMDAAMVETAAVAGDYFDGDTPDTADHTYAWKGTAHNSQSTKSAATWVPTPHAFTRFVGRITDLTLGWDDAGPETPDAGLGQVVAVGALADIARRVVGDVPFPQELDGARIERVLTLAGFPPDPLYSDPGTVQVLPRDIDSQAALAVAQEVAVSANGVLWQTRESEIRYADSEHRRGIDTSVELDACDVLVTPSWQRSLEGLVNKVSLGYGTEPEGGEQPRYLAENPASIAALGTYDYSLTTVLAATADAEAMGQLLLVRNSSPVWIMAALPVDMKSLDDDRTMALLALDMHALVSLTGLPELGGAPTSAQLWVEGWTETLAWGVHEIQLAISGYCRTAPAPRWDDVAPGWLWGQEVWVEQARNLVENPSAENDILGWRSNDDAYWLITRDTSAPISGAASAMTTLQAQPQYQQASSIYLSGTLYSLPVTPGVTCYWSLRVRAEYARDVLVYVVWPELGSNSTPSDRIPIAANTPTTIRHTATPPAGAVYAYIVVAVYPPAPAYGNPVVGERVWYDNFMVTTTPGDVAYFDGDTPDTATDTYAWVGTPHASASTHSTSDTDPNGLPPTLTWNDATCLGPLPSYGRWADVPASLRWDQVDPADTWNTYAP